MSDDNGKGAGTTQESKLGFEPKTSYVPGFPPGEAEGDREDYLLTQVNQDLSLEARTTLGNFLSDMSKGKLHNSPSSNAFTLDGGSSETQLYNRDTGLPVDLVVQGKHAPTDTVSSYESAGATLGSFIDLVEGYDPDAAAKFKSTAQSDYGSSDNPFSAQDESGAPLINKNIRKGGHTLLPNVKSIGSTSEVGNAVITDLPDDAPSVQKRISNVLLNNRFNPKSGQSPFITNFEKTNNRFGYSLQKNMGKYDPNTAQAPDVEFDDLRKIALSLMVRATGHGGGIGLGFESDDPDKMTMDQVVLPSTLQLGAVKQSVVELQAQNAFGAEKITKIRADLLSELNESQSSVLGGGGGAINSTSYGSLNSHLEPFDGPLPAGMMVQAVAGIIGILAFSALVNLITAGFWSDEDEEDPVDPTKLSKGRHRADNLGGDMAEMFGIPRIDHHFSSCMMYGFMAFCGLLFEPKVTAAQRILDGAANIASAPGYYAIVFRNVVRDIEQIVKSVTDLITKLPTLGISGGIGQVFAIVDAIVSSATWRFLMVMVQVGNQVLNSRHGHPRLVDPDVDSLPVGPTTRVMKSRVAGGANETNALKSNSLSWAHSANVSRYILPASLDATYRGIGKSPEGSTTLSALLNGKFAQPDGKHNKLDKDGKGDISAKFAAAESEKALPGRISSEYVEYIENALDSEYMPFYFHDLRTNEIISFHAFLNSLSDSFAPEWTNVDGYGRMDSVKIYNKTARSIGIDFTVVATSEEDFDRMWWDINKLVTMVYPQWSKGRSRTQGDSGFIQPFSQIPTASPVIRLRFGDLIKSNYSKFNLSRLFGVGTTSWKVSKDDNSSEELAKWMKKASKAKHEVQKYTKNSKIEPLDPDAGGKSGGLGQNLGGALGLSPAGSAAFPTQGYQEGDIVTSKFGCRVHVRKSDGGRIKKRPHSRKLRTHALKLKIVGFKWHDKKTKITKAERQKFALSNKTGGEDISKYRKKIKYICELTSPEAIKWLPKKYGTDHKHLVLYHTQIIGLSKQTTNAKWHEKMGSSASGPAASSGSESIPKTILEKTNKFFTPKENFVVKAFESTRGRGMAGVITALSFDWGEATWETTPGRRAPHWLKVSISFDPIHDLPLGIDYDGMMRAPAYNVGKAMEAIGGDPYNESPRDEAAGNNAYYAQEAKKTNDEPPAPQKKDAGEGGGGLSF